MNKVFIKILTILALVLLMSSVWADKALRDPTQPPGATVNIAVSKSDIKIQAIFYNKTKPAILVDGKYYYEGDALSGAIIVKINRDDVLLRGEGGEMKVSMYPSIRVPVTKTEKKESNERKG